MTFKTALLGCAAAALLGAPALALAAPAPAPAAAGTEVETVVVTATKRSETVQNVAGQVTAETASDLRQIHARSFEDFSAFVPGLSYQSTSPANNLIAIRGVTTGGSQLSGAVGLYLDDIPIGASSSFGLGAQSFDVNVFDLNRVEVLNGPQGTLYGASSLGGALKYVTAAPDLNGFAASGEIEGSTTAHGGDNSALRGMVNIPLAEGKAAIRIDGVDQFDSGYTDDPVNHRDNLGSARTSGGRISLLVKPTDDLDVRLTAFTQRIQGTGFDVALRDPVTHAPTLGAYDQYFPLNQPSVSALTLFSGVVNYDLHWAKLTSVTGYQYDHGRSLTDVSGIYDPALSGPIFGTVTDAFGLPVDTNTKKFTEELRLASNDNKHFEWLVGGYYDHEQTHEIVDLVDGSTPDGTFFGVSPFTSELPSTYRELAVFADGTYYFTDRIDLTLGVRYSQQHQTYDETVSGLLATGSSAVLHPAQAGSNQSVATYLINPRWRITDDLMVYARVASGFRPGGPNFVLAPGLGNPTFQPDTLWNYELGEKATFLDKKATLNFDIYDIEWKDIQLTVNNGGVNQLENAGNARVQGAELTFGYRILPTLTLGGSAAYTDAHLVTAAPVLGLASKGARLPLSPKYNFALVANYNFNIGAGFAGGFTVTDRWIGDRTTGFAGSPVSPLYKLASYNTVDLDLAIYAPRNIEIDAFVKNVFDKAGEVSASTLANEYNPAAPVPVQLSLPRTVGLALKFKM